MKVHKKHTQNYTVEFELTSGLESLPTAATSASRVHSALVARTILVGVPNSNNLLTAINNSLKYG